jgi:hypothetical protein
MCHGIPAPLIFGYFLFLFFWMDDDSQDAFAVDVMRPFDDALQAHKLFLHLGRRKQAAPGQGCPREVSHRLVPEGRTRKKKKRRKLVSTERVSGVLRVDHSHIESVQKDHGRVHHQHGAV